MTDICYNLQAYKLGLYGPKTVWIFFAWYSSGFWTKDLDDVACSADEMEQAADGIFIFGVSYKSSPSKQTISDMTGKCDVHNTFRYRIKSIRIASSNPSQGPLYISWEKDHNTNI